MKDYVYRILFVFWTIFVGINSTSLYADEKSIAEIDGANVRIFIYDLIDAADPRYPKKEEIASRIRSALKKHPEVYDWMARTQKPSTLLEHSKLLGTGEHKEPASGGSESEKNSGVWTSFLNFSQAQTTLNLLNPLNYRFVHSLTSPFIKGIGKTLGSISVEQIPDEFLYQLSKYINKSVNDIRLSDTYAVKMMTTTGVGFDINRIPEAQRETIINIFTGYFDNLPFYLKKRIVMAYLQLDSEASPVDKLAVIINHTGPILQKLLQQFGKEFDSPEIVAMLKKLKKSVKYDSYEDVERILQKNLTAEERSRIVEISEKPLGSGTIAQVHKAKYRDPSTGEEKDLIAKIQHKYVAVAARDELISIQKLKLDDWGRDAIKKIKEVVDEEMDFRIEYQNLVDISIYNQPDESIMAVKPASGIAPNRMVFLMERAKGIEIDHYKSEDLQKLGIDKKTFVALKARALENLFDKWYQNALLGSGLAHADLHSGNIFLDFSRDWNGQLRSQITLIDAGNVVRLDLNSQKAIIKMGIAFVAGFPEEIVDCLKSLTEMTDMQRTLLIIDLKQIIASDTSYSSKISKFIGQAIKRKVKLPPQLINFNRGRQLLMDQISQVNKELEEVDPSNSIPRIYVGTMIVGDTVGTITKDILLGMFKKIDSPKITVKELTYFWGKYLWQLQKDVRKHDYSKVECVGGLVKNALENAALCALNKVFKYSFFADDEEYDNEEYMRMLEDEYKDYRKPQEDKTIGENP